jgi:microcystin-dependent protein
MLVQIVTENGQKKIQALTADTGAGNPVGTIIPMYKKSSPSGYLYCDGSTFDQTKYPALYQYLGSNVLPDYRECVAVGAEQNTTDKIASHDVYTEGQFKDDQLQEHIHNSIVINSTGTQTGAISVTNQYQIETAGYNRGIATGRKGTVTRGKRKAVYFYIKATSGLTENQQENVLNTINDNLSYSITEHKTGKKWIDGKDIYSLVIINLYFTQGTRLTYNLGNNISTAWIDFTHSHIYGDFGIRQPWNQSDFYVDNGVVNFTTQHPDGYLCAVVEYTKTV